MSGESELGKSLAKWLTKAKTMPAPPGPNERREMREQREGKRSQEPIRQLNLKVSDRSYRRIKGLAYRDRLSLVRMLDEMLELYENKHGKLDSKS